MQHGARLWLSGRRWRVAGPAPTSRADIPACRPGRACLKAIAATGAKMAIVKYSKRSAAVLSDRPSTNGYP
ncbi:hypothetical protein L541_1308 [Bordetella hinzii CA90 BAL1384]|uniref:Uncharacterized protein n=1 Tax=Bordetella hinzii OH87 BAL007II TaxID=1331262 RepID=A0ABR4R6V3_9BORD|nr:hypothetical protein L544_3047 [Bordetella hinzii OH87 BAL007II]KCB31370.1 hypothetical protein L543_2875 [Bordetella hinzii L60]KCB39240.1 hypothetical protein L541_1308 [Bordetella hinzii CA90 BAL1384]KCB47362.1 hypothetical protein L538_1027 [Bordetella hinzii 4161]KCB52780.1 hypothetical protein L537_3238 [Bordetella hinzii 1277]